MATEFHFRPSTAAALVVISFLSLVLGPAWAQDKAPRTYLGFDVNEYPGDSALSRLRSAFSFVGYWLNLPPGVKTNNWTGTRARFLENGFGFLILFNGRLDRELKSELNAHALGGTDAKSAGAAARREGFPVGSIIFLDQEEGGRLLPEQMAYVLAWADAINAEGFSAGVYCSGIAVKEGNSSIATAADIREHEAGRHITYFVYNDLCPPSPGCAYPGTAPSPTGSGVPFAAVWQFAQSPRRSEFTKSCRATYARDNNCYPPDQIPGDAKRNREIYLDLDSATSPDPSNGR
ncbi:MAG TPA: glycoside hydrolase domain-containing protein [Candidatus Acidoferrales bacterium]